MVLNSRFWLRLSLINLLIVAILGFLMRYKIGFEFPYLDQKKLQHSHSHFAFVGWISHTIMVLMIGFLEDRRKFYKVFPANRQISYNNILTANLICAYGMLISFIVQGYGVFSIAFSTASIVVAYLFGYQYWKDLKDIDKNLLSLNWFKAAIFFNIISSLGTFALAYMMLTKNIHQNEYLASIYYYLHFQYNGWFFFACMGLFVHLLNLKGTDHPFYRKVFWVFFIACLPAYFLSTLWLNLPGYIYVLTVIAAFVQVFAWFRFLWIIFKIKTGIFQSQPFFLRYIIFFVAIALSIKLLLQLGSTIPSVSQLAFGFRPIVIAYLHLVLLAVISLFLLYYIFVHYILINKQVRLGIITFSTGVFLNELLLAIQGIGSFNYTLIPFINEALFAITGIMVLGIGITVFYSIKKQ